MIDIVAYTKEVKFFRTLPKSKISAQKYLRRFKARFGEPSSMNELDLSSDVKIPVWIAKQEAERQVSDGVQTLEDIIRSIAEDRVVTLQAVKEEAPHYASSTVRQTLCLMSQAGDLTRCGRGEYTLKTADAEALPKPLTIRAFVLEMSGDITATKVAKVGEFRYSSVQAALFRMHWDGELIRVRHGVYRRAAE